MTPPRVFEVATAQEIHRILRARANELNVTRAAIEGASKLTGGYASKVLADPPIRHMRVDIALRLARALGLICILVESEEALTQIAGDIGARQISKVTAGLDPQTMRRTVSKPDRPASEYDNSHLSKGAREKLKDLDPKIAAEVRRIADTPPDYPSKRP